MTRLRLIPEAEWAETIDDCRPILSYLMDRGGMVAIDTETTGLDVMRDRVLYWSMATADRRWVFPIEVIYAFGPLFDRKDILWALANAKYDMHLLANHGVTLAGKKWDIIVMDALEDDTRSHGLKDQAKRDFGVDWGDFKDLFINADYIQERFNLDKKSYTAFKKMNIGDKLNFIFDEDPSVVIDYASCDAYFTYLLAELRAERLQAESLPTDICEGLETLQDYFEIIEVPLTDALWAMERRGLYVDLAKAKEIDIPMREGIRGAEKRMFRAVGKEFNPRSSDQLVDVMFESKDGLKLTPLRLTDGGKSGKPAPKTDEKTLNMMLNRQMPDKAREFIKALLEHKTLTKLHGTYVRDIETLVGPDGRVHGRINQAGTRTGRLSISNPGLQQIPARTAIGKRIREMFTAEKGNVLLDLDYPQIEFRIVAVLANQLDMMEDIRKGWDIHNANTARIFAHKGVTYEKVVSAKKKDKDDLTAEDKEILSYRDQSKTVGFGTLYGQGPTRMANELNITLDEAKELQHLFKSACPKISEYEEDIKGYAYENGQVFTMLGRIRRLHSITDEYNRGRAAAEERQALNTNVQGSGAEMMKLAILRCEDDEKLKKLGVKLLLTVHDELLAECPEENAEEGRSRMIELMGDPYKWGPININYPVPITPDGDIARSWAEAK